MHVHGSRRLLRPIRFPRVFQVPEHFLLLRVDRDRRLAATLAGHHAAIDVLELAVAVGMLTTLTRLSVGLQTVAQARQHPTHRRGTGAEPPVAQAAGQTSRALAGPTQGMGRGTAGGRLDEPVEGVEQLRLRLAVRFASAAFTSLAVRRERFGIVEFLETVANGAIRETGGRGDEGDAAPPEIPRLGGGPASTTAFVEIFGERQILAANRFPKRCILHELIMKSCSTLDKGDFVRLKCAGPKTYLVPGSTPGLPTLEIEPFDDEPLGFQTVVTGSIPLLCSGNYLSPSRLRSNNLSLPRSFTGNRIS